MAKKGFLVLVIAALAAGGIFAQTDMANNTITVDIGPTLIGLGISQIGNLISDENGISTSGFGIAAQYERQISRPLSVAGRFAYLGGGMGLVESDTSVDMDLKSFSLEGHVRFYPFGETFFLNGMLGYGYLSSAISGTVDMLVGPNQRVSFTGTRSYVKYGAKLGWRMSFGRQGGGFTFEPSIGYYGGIGLGDTLGDQLMDEVGGSPADMQEFNDMFKILENYIFIGGPRVSLSFGWRF